SDTQRMFGSRDQVDPVRHLIGSAWGWGGNPSKDALYLPITPAKNDGTTVHKLTVKDVPVDGFWSISVYNADGYFQPSAYHAFTLNIISTAKGGDGPGALRSSGCAAKRPNSLPIMKAWQYTKRLSPQPPEILNGKWAFPEPPAAS